MTYKLHFQKVCTGETYVTVTNVAKTWIYKAKATPTTPGEKQ